MPQFTITVNRPEVSVSTTQTGPSVTINETPVTVTQNTSNIAVTSTPHSVTVNTAATTIQTTTLDEAFQGEYSSVHTYHRGDLVRYEQSVYVYIDTTPRTTNAPDVDTDYWVLLFSETGLTGEQVIGLNRAINLTTWDPATEYSLGDIVMLRQDYNIDVGVSVPSYTMYRLYHISGSINVNPFTHSAPPSIIDDVATFDENSAWQNLSGVRSINGFSGDVSLQELLDAGGLALTTTSFHQGSNEAHGSFEAFADDSYFYGNALYIGTNTSDQLVGFLLTNSGGSGYVVMDPADGKIKFTNDLTNVYPLPTSTDDLAEGTTNKYYNNTLVADYLANNIITASEIRAVTGGYMVITDHAENNYFYVDDNVTQAGAGSHTWQFNNDGSTSFPTFSLPATDGSASQVLTTNGLGVVTFATPSTSNITEGTNLFYTTTRFDDRLATKTTDNVSEGTTNKYFTNTRFDDRLATKSTTNLAEGTNLYYTTARQNTDFDARLGAKSTTNLAEGTNLYYTSTRANSDFDTRLATKSTTALAEGTNLYHTDSRVRSALSGSTGITYNNTTGAIAVDTSTIATQSYVGTAIANLVDSSPSTLDTLNELAAALGDDPNFATTVSTAIGTKLATADFTTTANTWIGTKSTTALAEGTNLYYTNTRARSAISATGSLSYDSATGVVSYTTPTTTGITEGTNLYYTDTRARASNSAGTGVTYDSGTGVISIGQSVATSADVTFNTVNANITDDNYVLGQLVATRNTAYVPPASPLTTLAGSNGFVVASSGGGAGYGANIAIRYHSGDTTAGTNNAAALVLSGAGGTNSVPVGNFANQVLGAHNFDGYTTGTSNNYAGTIATVNQGAGTTAIAPLQAQGYDRQAFTNSTTVTTAVTGASGTGSVATLNFTLQNTAPYIIGQTVTIAGMTPSGYNGTVVLTGVTTSSISYANATTGFTSGGTIGAANTVTAAGTGYRIRGFASSTPLYVQNRFNFMDLTASAAAFKSNTYTFADEVITGSTLTAKNYMTLGATVGSVNQDTFTVKNTAGTSTYASFASAVGTINQDTFTVKNTAATTTYATFASTGHTLSAAGLHTFTRTTTGTPGTQEGRPSLNIQLTRTDQATPNNGDSTSFRTRVAGSNGTFYTLSDVNSSYSTTGNVGWNLSLANGDQTTGSFSGLSVISSGITSTTIRAGTASATPGASTVSDIMNINDTSIINYRAHRNTITTGTVARGGEYTVPATANGSIELTITAGSGTTHIDVDAVASDAATGGMYSILIYNNSGANNIDVQVRNNGVNIGLANNLDIGDRAIASVYVVGGYAACEIMDAA
jgi:hypothetical protein